jgi:hypothetical protein
MIDAMFSPYFFTPVPPQAGHGTGFTAGAGVAASAGAEIIITCW